MCNTIFISTDSDRDLAALASTDFLFKTPDENDLRITAGLLKHKNVWYLSSKYGGCSCHYRHLMRDSIDLGFEDVVDWCKEDDDNVASTKAVYDVFATLVMEGSAVDILDLWESDSHEDILQLTVKISEVNRDTFRFFEECRFELVP